MLTFYNVIQLYGYELFDGIVLNENIDKETMINTIMDKCGQMSPLYNDYNLLKGKIQNWFKKYEQTINRLWVAHSVEYNMIENYERIEEHSTVRAGDNVVKVSPYDSDSFINDSKNENSDTTTTNSRVHGNIGVATAASMLRENIELLPRLNIYENIANMFYYEFCIYVA